jgi:hypothetical protein
MLRTTLIRQRFVVLFSLGLLFLFSPFVQLFDSSLAPFGIPLLYLYLFGVWGTLIAASAWILRSDAE